MLVVPEMIQVELVTVRPVPVTVTVAALIIDRGSRGVRVTGSAAARARETTMLLMMSQRCPGGPPASRSSGKTISNGYYLKKLNQSRVYQ
jgi:hypothetical protein